MGITIIGCGGVGSNLAQMFVRQNSTDAITLVDFDIVEPKNIARQFFFKEQIGMKKTEALKQNLLKINPEMSITTYDMKIEDKMDLILFNKTDLLILATDNLKSKIMIAENFEHTAIINCEKDMFEVYRKPKNADKKAWIIDSGYNSTQTYNSNMRACLYMLDEWTVRGILWNDTVKKI